MVIFVLHNLRSVFNVGSILRTGEFLGFQNFVLTGYTPGLENKNLFKTSLGAEKNLNVLKVKKILFFVKNLKKDGYQIVSLECFWKKELLGDFKSKYCFFYSFKPKKKIAVILGNEVNGIDRKILAFSDKIIEIPRQGKVKESLNVAIAFAIFAVYLKFFCKKIK